MPVESFKMQTTGDCEWLTAPITPVHYFNALIRAKNVYIIWIEEFLCSSTMRYLCCTIDKKVKVNIWLHWALLPKFRVCKELRYRLYYIAVPGLQSVIVQHANLCPPACICWEEYINSINYCKVLQSNTLYIKKKYVQLISILTLNPSDVIWFGYITILHIKWIAYIQLLQLLRAQPRFVPQVKFVHCSICLFWCMQSSLFFIKLHFGHQMFI